MMFGKKKFDTTLLDEIDFDAARPQRMSMAELDAIESGRVEYGQWTRDNDADQESIDRALEHIEQDRVGRRTLLQLEQGVRGTTQRDRVLACARWARDHYRQDELSAIADDPDRLQDLYDEFMEQYR